jgi:alpha-L-fucosidase
MELPITQDPIIASNIAKFKPTESSWSWDGNLMDYATDDNFNSGWVSNKEVKIPWIEALLGTEQPFNLITITGRKDQNDIFKYKVEYMEKNEWKTIFSGSNNDIIKIHRFDRVWGNKIRITIEEYSSNPIISEIGVYNERKI